MSGGAPDARAGAAANEMPPPLGKAPPGAAPTIVGTPPALAPQANQPPGKAVPPTQPMSSLAPTAAGDAAAELELTKTRLAAELKALTEEQTEAMPKRKRDKATTDAHRKQAGARVANTAAVPPAAGRLGGGARPHHQEGSAS